MLPTLMVFGSIVLCVVFYSHLWRTPAARYAARDDAVITLSHARNLVEYGFIGTSPSGERVEGFSAPLQFLIAAALYSLLPFEYETFFRWQTLIGTLTLGLVIAALLSSGGKGSLSWPRTLFIVTSLVLTAEILADSSAFLWWHASGMENVYKSVAFVALLWAFDRMLVEGRILWSVVWLVPVAAITRIDAAVPVALLLATFVGLWFARHRNQRALAFAATGLLPLLAFMAWRVWYFGQFEPNTAAAQSISIATRLAAAARSPLNALADDWAWFSDVGTSLFAFQLIWLIPLGWHLRRQTSAVNRLVLIAVLTGACVVQYALFGPARMDPTRTVPELSLCATLSVPFLLLACEPFEGDHLLVGLAILGCSVAFAARAPIHRTEIGWGAARFEPVGDQLARFAAGEDIPRPLIANPDLGAVSWRKQFNIVDFGRLGSSIIPRIASPAVYVATVAEPDIIELHAPWSCQYQELFAAPEFDQQYVRVSSADPETPTCPGHTGSNPTYWLRRAIMRKSDSPERAFLDRFRKSLDPRLVDAELAKCLGEPGRRPCAYLGRTLFRFVPELKHAGLYQKLSSRLLSDPRLRIEHAFFTSSIDSRWWQTIIERTPELLSANLELVR